MSALDVLERLRALDVRVWTEGDRLRYEAPRGALTPELRAQVADCRSELIDVLRSTGEARRGAPAPAPRPDRFPVSPTQRRLWIIERLEAPGSAYHVYGAARLRGRLDVGALRGSLARIIERHESLRTGFAEESGEPLQVVAAAVDLPLEIVDLPSPETGWLERARLVLADLLDRPFDIAVPPLLRAVLVRRAPDDHVLGLAMHHLVADGWSVSVFVDELAAGYAGAAPIPLGRQYGDYARAVRGRLQGATLERELEHWRCRLEGAPQVLALPADRPHPPLQSFAGATVTRHLPATLAHALGSVSRREKVTLFATLLAGFSALLHRYTGLEDFVVGSPFGGRPEPDLERLIGCFVNTLPIRCDLAGDPSFRELIGRSRDAVLDALAHEEVPFELLVDALHAPRDPSRQPLVQVLFALQSAPAGRLELPGLTVEPLALEARTAKFDLSVGVEEAAGETLLVSLEYSSDLFDRDRIERLAEHYEHLLASAASDPGTCVSRLALLSGGERRQLMTEFAGTDGSAADERSLCDLVEHQVARTPDAIAVACGDARLTYAQLDRRANQIAHRLRALGVGPESLVAVCLERSPDLIVAMLAILKAGGAYVPLDPAYPRDRVAFVLADTRAPVLLTQRRLEPRLPEHAGRTLSVEDLGAEVAREPPAPPPRALHPDNLAYVIYTSGSTGRPKGVAIAHRSAVAMLDWARREFSRRDLRAVLASTSVCFDLSVFEIFLPLSVGTTAVLAVGGPLDLLEPPELDVSLVNTVPSAARELVRAGALPAATRVVCLAGEPLSESLARALYELPQVERVYNLYGPSEDTTYSTVALLARAPGQPPVGRPIAGSRAYVLDAHGEIVPIGVPGELYLGGRGLARGYLARPATTAQRFVPDPFGAPGERLYRTGDRVRHRPDGQLEFLGRVDHQLKIRGYRIEPGEIEAALVRHPAVREAVVVGRAEPGSDDLRLVAYAVTATPMQVADLRRHLAETLPGPLVPHSIELLDALPLTPTRKVDRRALPAPGSSRAAAGVSAAPRDATETLLAAVWAAVLRIERVGVHDNFFDVGGDSILALQVVARAARAGLRLSPADLLRHQTVAELAVAARAEEPEEHAAAEPGPLPLTPVQRWFFELEQPSPDHWNQAVLVELDPSIDAATLAAALERLVERHAALRTRFVQRGGEWHAEILAAGTLVLDDRDLSSSPDWPRELERSADELQRSLDLGAGRVFVACRFGLGAERPARLLLIAHHLVVDGVTWRVLLEELELLLIGEQPARPSVSPRVWAERLELLARAPETQAETAFWSAVSEVPPLPRDRAGAVNLQATARTVSVRLPESDTRALLTDTHHAYRSRPDELLLAAVATAVARWGGGPRVLIDVERHGRDTLPDLDASRTAGWFTTIVPTLLEPSPARDPGQRLLAVKEQIRAVPGTGAGFGLLRYLARSAEVAALPVAEISFNYLGQADRPLDPRQVLRPAAEDVGPMLAPGGRRPHLVEVVGIVEGGCLRVDWRYGDAHESATVKRLVDVFAEELRMLLGACTRPGAAGVSPSDFPDAALDDAGLAAALAEVGLRPDDRGTRAIEDILPLSFQQQGMLIEGLATPVPLHVEQVALEVRGVLDVQTLRRAWQVVVDRHPALRSALSLRPEPLQIQFERALLPFARHAVSGEDGLDAWLEADRRRAFDPHRPPLMRVAVLDLGADRRYVVWTFHHAVADGWSVAVVLREALALYTALTRGGEPALPAVGSPRAYHRWLRSRDLAAAERFWREELSTVELPTPLGRVDESAQPRGVGFGQCDTTFGDGVSARLATLARARQVTLSTVVQGAWALLVARFSGCSEVVFGTTVAGRPPQLPGIEEAVGLYITTLPFRVAVPAEGPFWDWLADVQEHHAAIREHDHSAGLVHGWAGVDGRTPLYESVIVVENYPVDVAGLGAELGARVVGLSSRGARTRHALALLVTPGPRIGLQLVYDRRRIAEADAERVLEALVDVLAGAARGVRAGIEQLAAAVPDGSVPSLRPVAPPSAAAEPSPPRTPLELELARLWEDLLGARNIDVRQNFFDLGGHSLLALELLDRVRARYGADIQLSTLLSSPTLEELAHALEGVEPRRGSLVLLHDGRPAAPLFLVPGASGNPMSYLPLARSFGDERPFYGFTLPSHSDPAQTFASIEQLAGVYVQAVRETQPDGPYLLAGHSFGGAVAFEMARLLVDAGACVGLVAIVDLPRPRRVDGMEAAIRARDDPTWIADIAGAIGAFLGKPIALDVDALRRIEAADRSRALLEHLIEARIVPPDARPALVPALVEAYRASAVALAAYEAEPLNVPIVLLRPSEGPTRDDGDPAVDRTLGWEAATSHPVLVRRMPGSHITMIKEPHVHALARAFRDGVAAAEA